MSLLEITQLSHSFGDSCLYREANLSLHSGEHIGIVGPNGAGKSTLIQLCTEQLVPDKGRVSWQPRITVGYLDQYARLDPSHTIQSFLQTAFSELYEWEGKMTALYEKAAEGKTEALQQAARYQEQLEQAGFYTLETRIEQVAQGLGLLQLGLNQPLWALSGGQRAKAILAKLLLEEPDVLLLDEPTNFLDKEHVAWLADFLSKLPNAYMVVSHDVAFLDKIATHIVDIDGGTISKYYGSYQVFLQKKALVREDHQRQYAAQQKEIRRTEEFIRRNIAGRKTRMAQGRRKQLNRMERMEALTETEIRPQFHFLALPATETEHLTVQNLSVGYDKALLSHLDFAIQGCRKVVITGFNGVGKSTLLKTLVGELPALEGRFVYSEQVKLGYYEQDLCWEDETESPLQILLSADSTLTTQEARQILFRCGISRDHVMQEVGTLSGGEQAKVKLCLMTRIPCNFLIMDEPTNHLDRAAKEVLQESLCHFPGTVLLVSHEEEFYRDWAQQVISIG